MTLEDLTGDPWKEAERLRTILETRGHNDAQCNDLQARVVRVRRLHRQQGDWCGVCRSSRGDLKRWPCPTIQILNGEQS